MILTNASRPSRVKHDYLLYIQKRPKRADVTGLCTAKLRMSPTPGTKVDVLAPDDLVKELISSSVSGWRRAD